MNLTAACNVDCHCMSDVFEPVCGADNLIYFSPCYAGCHNTSADRKVLDLVYKWCISQLSKKVIKYFIQTAQVKNANYRQVGQVSFV